MASLVPISRRLRVGDARVSVFEIASLELSMQEVFGPDVPLARYFDKKTISAPELFPTSSILVESGDSKVMVDPSDARRLVAPGHFRAPAGYRPPPTLEAQLKSVGVRPKDVTHVVVTHLHYDHYAGVTGGSGPAYPNARCYIPKRDWEMPDIVQAREKGDPDVTDTLGVLEAAGRLEKTDGALRLPGGITLEPFPGESPGHQVVGVKSKGETCYCVGDLYHLVPEVEHPELAASWTDARVLLESRRGFSKRAAAEKALVVPGHLAPGRITFRAGAPKWTRAALRTQA